VGRKYLIIVYKARIVEADDREDAERTADSMTYEIYHWNPKCLEKAVFEMEDDFDEVGT